MATTHTYTIIKNVELPKPRCRKAKYPFAEMEIGDAFDVPVSQSNNARTAAFQYGKRHGGSFTARKISADIARCYRVA